MKREKRTKVKARYLTLLFIICCLLFVISCPVPYIELPEGEDAPAGMGYVTLSIDGSNMARTIIPATAQSDFTAYKLVFSQGGTAVHTYARTNNSDLAGPYLLNAGAWTLKVEAFLDDVIESVVNGDTFNPASLTLKAAEGEATFTVSNSLSTPVAVSLAAIISGTGEGTFSWNIEYPGDVTSASMTITPLAGTGGSEQTFYFKRKAGEAGALFPTDGSFNFSVGYYRVVFNLEIDDGSDKKASVRREILHIYQNMESRFPASGTHSFPLNSFTGTLSGDVGIEGDAWLGGTLTANITGLGGTGTVHYQWYRGTTPIGTNSNTYTITTDDTVGAVITVVVNREGYNGSKTSGGVTVEETIPSGVPFVITGAGTNFTATLDSTYTVIEDAAIQDVISKIRAFNAERFDSADCEIQFGDGTPLSIGDNSISFADTETETWGKITLSGSITSTAGTIILYDGISIDVKGTIRVTASPGIAINNTSTGKITVSDGASITSQHNQIAQGTIWLSGTDSSTAVRLEINGGTVENIANSTNARAIYNDTAGGIEINGGLVRATLSTAYAIFNNKAGELTISGGTVSTALTNQITIYNNGTGAVNVESGTVSATGTGAKAIHNENNGTVNVEGGTVSAGTGAIAIHNENNGTVNVEGGTVSATTGRAIHNERTGAINVEGGTVSATGTTGIAIRNNGTGKITINGTDELVDFNDKTYLAPLITSANTQAAQGTILLSGTDTNTAVRLQIDGGTVQNTAANGRTIRNSTTGGIEINGGIVSAASVASAAIYSIGTGKITINGSNETVEFNGETYPAPLITSTTSQTFDSTIRLGDSDNNTVAVQLEINGGTVQNVSTTAVQSYAIGMQSPGKIEITGGTVSAVLGTAIHATNGTIIIGGDETLITSGSEYSALGTIYIGSNNNQVHLIINGGTIQHTSDYELARAIVTGSSSPTITINGGTVQVTGAGTSAYAIDTSGTSTLTIKDGEVKATTGGRAINNVGAGKVNIEGGTISTTTGEAIYNNGSGTITISGTTAKIVATEPAVGYAIYNNGDGIVTLVDGATRDQISGLLEPSDLLDD